MDRTLWESLFDCPIELNRLHDAAVVTYATLWGSEADAAPPSRGRRSAWGRLRFLVGRRAGGSVAPGPRVEFSVTQSPTR